MNSSYAPRWKQPHKCLNLLQSSRLHTVRGCPAPRPAHLLVVPGLNTFSTSSSDHRIIDCTLRHDAKLLEASCVQRHRIRLTRSDRRLRNVIEPAIAPLKLRTNTKGV